MKFPVIMGEQRVLPSGGSGACPICQDRPVSTDVEHVVVRGGALLAAPDGTVDLTARNEAFLFMDWESGIRMDGRGREIETPHAEFEIARDVAGGQFTMLFCSTACLRKFLNECVDRLEGAISSCS